MLRDEMIPLTDEMVGRAERIMDSVRPAILRRWACRCQQEDLNDILAESGLRVLTLLQRHGQWSDRRITVSVLLSAPLWFMSEARAYGIPETAYRRGRRISDVRVSLDCR